MLSFISIINPSHPGRSPISTNVFPLSTLKIFPSVKLPIYKTPAASFNTPMGPFNGGPEKIVVIFFAESILDTVPFW